MAETLVALPARHNERVLDARDDRGGIVAGVDGSRESLTALARAVAIARRWQSRLFVTMVIPPFPSYRINPGARTSGNTTRLRLLLKEIELRDILEPYPGEDWLTHEVIVGNPAEVLATVSEGRNAELIVVGRAKHEAMSGLFDVDTTVEVMRLAATPVMAVNKGQDPPTTAVAAIDFFPASIRAARAALRVLGTTGTLYLPYVAPPSDLLPAGFILPNGEAASNDPATRLRHIAHLLAAPPGVQIEPIVLRGTPVPAVAQFADAVNADLVAVGSHGRTRAQRFLLGSVSTSLVRTIERTILVAPPDE